MHTHTWKQWQQLMHFKATTRNNRNWIRRSAIKLLAVNNTIQTHTYALTTNITTKQHKNKKMCNRNTRIQGCCRSICWEECEIGKKKEFYISVVCFKVFVHMHALVSVFMIKKKKKKKLTWNFMSFSLFLFFSLLSHIKE